jgi:hypothetical protein
MARCCSRPGSTTFSDGQERREGFPRGVAAEVGALEDHNGTRHVAVLIVRTSTRGPRKGAGATLSTSGTGSQAWSRATMVIGAAGRPAVPALHHGGNPADRDPKSPVENEAARNGLGWGAPVSARASSPQLLACQRER